MKYFIALASCIILMISCGRNQNSQTVGKVDHIYGSWAICVTKGNGHVIHSNICRTILFNEDGSGRLSLENELICNFNWKLDNNSVVFSFDSSNAQSEFLSGDSEYSMKLYDKSDLHYLELQPKDKDIVYFLTQSLNNN